MSRMGVYDQIKKAFQDIIAPEVHALRGEIQRLDGRIGGLDAKLDAVDQKLTHKIDGLDARLSAKIDGVETRIDSLRTETVSMKGELLAEIRRLDARVDGVDRELRTAIDIRERLAALEARRSA